eukprot:CAMPEP_0119550424 /NCGR_PEP_ID=MMETSP1352-20130426/3927_1 /TAXON_ID=265584 /ORGANISM="Stauroneis constricta, Strain CCMP1120" /LENGTH=149 /DNA_ID=CAMNT_0007596261 /DNA_START=121 /DNA_END=567 /DNA_ORIENTATION=-
MKWHDLVAFWQRLQLAVLFFSVFPLSSKPLLLDCLTPLAVCLSSVSPNNLYKAALRPAFGALTVAASVTTAAPVAAAPVAAAVVASAPNILVPFSMRVRNSYSDFLPTTCPSSSSNRRKDSADAVVAMAARRTRRIEEGSFMMATMMVW